MFGGSNLDLVPEVIKTICDATLRVAVLAALPNLKWSNLAPVKAARTNPCAVFSAVAKAAGISRVVPLAAFGGKGMANPESVCP